MCYKILYCFFFNDTATTEIYTLSLHDALPIYPEMTRYFMITSEAVSLILQAGAMVDSYGIYVLEMGRPVRIVDLDRKSTRLNSSHANISYAVFCLKKKKQL